ncbi:uncharacterized protein LOC135303601 isoform X3 [Passer domesticus]|uniref:uncharacterized protein LOC135303601 isoform X3 n=1 Tax=Passer domesticus TaxID=48849 RepID=UPI0030FECBAE
MGLGDFSSRTWFCVGLPGTRHILFWATSSMLIHLILPEMSQDMKTCSSCTWEERGATIFLQSGILGAVDLSLVSSKTQPEFIFLSLNEESQLEHSEVRQSPALIPKAFTDTSSAWDTGSSRYWEDRGPPCTTGWRSAKRKPCNFPTLCPAKNTSEAGSSASWTLPVLSIALPGLVWEWEQEWERERLVGALAEPLETRWCFRKAPPAWEGAFGSGHIPRAQEQQDLCCAQQDRKNHLTHPTFAQLWCLSSQTQRAPAALEGPWSCPGCEMLELPPGCALSSRCRELPGLGGSQARAPSVQRPLQFLSSDNSSEAKNEQLQVETHLEQRLQFRTGSSSPWL